MADVSVEFGAKDTGLEATLKTVQAEMSRLETEIKSGELSFNQLTSAMRDLAKADKVSQQLQSIGGAAAGASPQVDKLGKDGKEMGDNVKKGSDKGGMSLGELAKASGVAGVAFAAGMAVFNTAMAGVQAVAASFGKALDLGGQLADLSAQTGVAAGELLVLQRAFDNTGAGAEKVSPAIAKMSSSIVDATSGTGAAAKTFDQLGLSAEALINLPAEQQFQKIGNALAGVANETQRSALASDVFGSKLGKDLLPLMTNFSGETRTATQQLGSMVDVMNESSDAFDSIGDGIKVAQGKLTEFAAGLMSVMAPAIEAVVTALTRIDAAQIGKDLGSAFVGAGEAMKGFQSAVDAFQAGNIGLALKSIFQSVKLQAMETGNSIVNIFTAAFKTAGDVLSDIFSVQGATFMLLRSSFDFVAGYAKDKIAGAMSDMFASMGPAFAGISASLKQHSEAGALAAELALQRIPIAADLAGKQISSALGDATAKFQTNLAAANTEFFNTEQQAKKVKAVQEEINTATAKHPALIADGAAEMRDLIAAQAESTRLETAKMNAAADIAVAKMNEVQRQIELNDAIATGNTADQARLQSIIEAEKGTARIKTLTEEYAKVIPIDEAARLANEIYRSEGNMLAAKKATTDTKTEVGTLGNLLAGITEVKVEDPIKKFKEESKQAQIELKGISKILNVDITGGSPVDMMKKLGLDPNAITGSQNQLDAIKGAIDILKGADPADVTPVVDQVGVQDNIDAVQNYIKDKLGGTTTANIEATADKNAADNAAGAIKDKVGSLNSNITTQTDANNIASTRSTIEQGLAGIPLTFTVDPEQIKKSIGTIDVSGGAGGGVMGDIKTLVDTIKGFVEKIEGKLPMTALA
jgi:hypothetical protein